MKDKIVEIIKWVFDITFIIILSFMYYLNEPVSSPKVIFIPKGSISHIITQMQQSNYNVSSLDKFVLRFIGNPQSGWIDMGETINTKADFLYRLVTSKAAMKSITLLPGETTYVFLDILCAELELNRNLLQQEYNSQSPVIEGVFVPNTYALPMGISEKMIIRILLNQSIKQMQDMSMKIFGEYNEKNGFIL